MILEQHYLACLAHASYLIGDEQTRTAWVIDPQRDIQVYLDLAAKHGLTITDVALTHLHADFVAGHLALRDAVGARVHVGAQAGVAYDHIPAADGDAYTFGAVRMVAWHTPGHTPEGVTWLVYDDAVDATRPRAALTGDTLFIGDVGRPDLLASAGMRAEDLAGMLYESVQRLLGLDDAVLVYPAHGAGSLCGRNLSKQTVSTIGEERRHNYALQPMSRAEFIQRVAAEQPPAPAYFAHDVAMNKADHSTHVATLPALDMHGLQQAVISGAQLVDVREGTAFAGGHLRGAINVGIDGQFAMWVGAVLDPRRPLVIIADPGREEEVVTRLRRVGFDRATGYLAGGMAAAPPELIQTLPRYDAHALRAALTGPTAPLLIDVRNPGEREQGFIPGSLGIPLPSLLARLDELPPDREVVVHCAGGYRSLIAASTLAAHGRKAADLVGGYGAWEKSAPVSVAHSGS